MNIRDIVIIGLRFREACEKNDMNKVIKYVNQGANIHYEKELSFRVACHIGHINVVKYLTMLYKNSHHKKIKIDICNGYGFWWSLSEGHMAVVVWLINLCKKRIYPMINIYNTAWLDEGCLDIFVETNYMDLRSRYLINLGHYKKAYRFNKFILV